jgi:hypothetical protein
MLACYALEDRSPWFILVFAGSSVYGFLEGPHRFVEVDMSARCLPPLVRRSVPTVAPTG